MTRRPDLDEIAAHVTHLKHQLARFLDGKFEPNNANVDKMTMYAHSPRYLVEVIAPFHVQFDVMCFMGWLVENIPAGASVWDVGCSCGFTGLTLAHYGYDVGFHDFEGLPLNFIRHYAEREGLDVKVVPYELPQSDQELIREFGEWLEDGRLSDDNGTTYELFKYWLKEIKGRELCDSSCRLKVFPPEYRDWAVALDVIEHTGNHLGFLRWMKDLARVVAFSIPNPPFLPPYAKVIDEWVDKEAIIWTIERRYRMIRNEVLEGRTYLVYE